MSKSTLANLRIATVHSICIALLAGVGGCAATNDAPSAQSQAASALSFVDLQSFDGQMHASLLSSLSTVDIGFYEKVTTTAIPERLQRWLAAVETNGGVVKVIPPPSSVTAKSPFMLLSAASSIYSASKMIKESNIQARYKVAQPYDAEIRLRVDEKGDTIVDKVVFIDRTQRK